MEERRVLAEVWYLANSGFAVKTGGRLLLFDYYLHAPAGAGIGAGVVPPEFLAGLDVTVFVSHGHYDHYNPAVFSLGAGARSVRFVGSPDVAPPCGAGAEVVPPGGRLSVQGLSVRALPSTDEGVAFLVDTGALTIYHAGDLNWWHWAGESEAYNRKMAADYLAAVDSLAGERIDLAFVPLDPRLGEEAYLYGLDAFMRRVGAQYVFPMHFGEEGDVCRRALCDPRTAPYRDRVVPLTRRGEHFCFAK